MLPTPPSEAVAPPALILSELPRWIAILSDDGPPPDLGKVERVDAAGVQLLAAALRWSPGRLRFDPEGPSPVAELWRRLGLDAPADADAAREGGRIVGLRIRGGQA